MTDDEHRRLKSSDRRAYRIEDLPDDLATQLEAGLDDLRGGVAEEADTVIGSAAAQAPEGSPRS